MKGVATQEAFARPEHDRDVFGAWERLHSGLDARPERVRGLIGDSWLRCKEHAVDPRLYKSPDTLNEDELWAHRSRNQTLWDMSAPLMAAARDFLSDAGSLLILTDATGLIISVEGDEGTRQRASEIALMPGAKWGELVTGTNAIGTALAVGAPIEVHGAEHFCEGIQRWTCSCAVVRDPIDHSIVGALDISGIARTYSRNSLAYVVSSAAQIEARLKEVELARRYRILEAGSAIASTAHTEGVVFFDRRGFAFKANSHATEALSRRGLSVDADQPLHVDGRSLLSARSGGALPEWLAGARIEPVIERGERVGSVAVLKTDSIARSRPTRPEPKAPPDPFAAILGSSPALQQVVERARLLAPARAPILLLGETGVGKELFARALHAAGLDGRGPFIAVNCAGLARDLLASELFGYAEGAFTGARKGGAEGKIEAAEGGTLFLDEIGEMPLELQGYLLRALEQHEIYRIGETQPRRVQFRLICATNRELKDEIAANRFRTDLYYRVAVATVRIPPLRERRDDIGLLAEHYLNAFADARGDGPRHFSTRAKTALHDYPWPGNVRELRNVIEAIGLISREPVVEWSALPDELKVSALPRATANKPATAGPLFDAETEAIRAALEAEAGNLTRAARRLGIAKSTLYAKLKAHALDRDVELVRRGKPH